MSENYQCYTRAQKKKLLSSSSALKDCSTTFLNHQVSEFLTYQMQENQRNQLKSVASATNRTMEIQSRIAAQNLLSSVVVSPIRSGTNPISTPETEYNFFQKNLQLQKQILKDHQMVHEYQTQLFEKHFSGDKKHKKCQSYQEVIKPTKSIAQDHPMIMRHILKIDRDISTLAKYFNQRNTYKKVLNVLRQNKKQNAQWRKQRLQRAFFAALIKNVMVGRYKRGLKVQF